MRKILACLVVLAAVGLTSSVASAGVVACDTLTSPPPGANVMGSQLGVGDPGCIENGLTFSNFSVSSVPTGMQVFLQSAAPSGTGATLGFQIAGFTLTSGVADLQLIYEVSGSNITSVDNTFGGTAGSSIAETVCKGTAVPVGGSCASGTYLTSFSNNIAGGTVSASFAAQNSIWIIKDITAALTPGLNSITVSGFANSTYSSGVPEPMTLSMMGVGLLGLGLISRRRKKS